MKSKQKQIGLLGVLAGKLKENRKLEYAVYGGILLLLVLLLVSSFTPKEEPPNTDTAEAAANVSLDAARDTEQRLEGILSNIRGAGKVTVMITYDSGPELVPAMNVDTNTNRAESADGGKSTNSEQKTETTKPAVITGDGGSEPIVLTQKEPAVRGVIVVAQGAGDMTVRMDLQRAVQTVLSVPAACIEVFEMQDNNGEEEQ
ncbi:MAG: hypothetical protein PHO41_01205 [Eubacteriales bacterium]|nr:hypothetical protein [Eubacteriales bacterium]